MRISVPFIAERSQPAPFAGGEQFVSVSNKTTAKTTTKTV